MQIQVAFLIKRADPIQEWIFVVMNKIIIGSLNGIETRMCFCVDGNDLENCNVTWQILIHLEQ